MANWLVSCGIIIAAALGINRLADRDEHNPEFATSPEGVVYPIRHGDGRHKDNGQPYDPGKAKGDKPKVDDAALQKLLTAAEALPLQKVRRLLGQINLNQGPVTLRTGGAPATPDEVNHLKDGLRRIIAEKKQRIEDEIKETIKQERALYAHALTESEQRDAARQYAALKRRERELRSLDDY